MVTTIAAFAFRVGWLGTDLPGIGSRNTWARCPSLVVDNMVGNNTCDSHHDFRLVLKIVVSLKIFKEKSHDTKNRA